MVVLAVVLPVAVWAEVVAAAGGEAAVAAARAGVGPARGIGLDVGQAGLERSLVVVPGPSLWSNRLVIDAIHQDPTVEESWESHRSIIRFRVAVLLELMAVRPPTFPLILPLTAHRQG